MHAENEKLSIKETINTVHANLDELIKDAEADEREKKLFVMTKNKKDDPPMDEFTKFCAYKAEERKFYLRYPQQHPVTDVATRDFILS